MQSSTCYGTTSRSEIKRIGKLVIECDDKGFGFQTIICHISIKLHTLYLTQQGFKVDSR